jgi:hypothetical protein
MKTVAIVLNIVFTIWFGLTALMQLTLDSVDYTVVIGCGMVCIPMIASTIALCIKSER